MNLLAEKKIVVIGGTTGIGLSAAKAFIEQGAKVIVAGRNEENVEQAKAELGKNGHAVKADARKIEAAVNAIDLCIKEFGDFDGLYHVAGGSGRKMGDGPLHELSLDGWNKTLELNLTSLMLSNQAAIKKFLELKTVDHFEYGIRARFFTIPFIFFHTRLCSGKISHYWFQQSDSCLLRER
jgi:NAD(P)-dependent dehydrogenase (short-subunit alcohol dehydrogenase family)